MTPTTLSTSILIEKNAAAKFWPRPLFALLGYSTNADIIEEFFSTRKVKIKSEKEFAKFVGKILAQDVVDEESGLVFGKAGEKLTTAMLKRMVDAGIDTIRIAEDADETQSYH